jgi:plasmid replication initiation protein
MKTSLTDVVPHASHVGILLKLQGQFWRSHNRSRYPTGGLERWLYRVARKHAGRQETGWQFTMRQLYEKSGSLARFSDFAIDVRKIVKGDNLSEYALNVERNEDREEIVYITPRAALPAEDPRSQPPRHPRRRVGRGIHSTPLKLGV